jgi:hypothetical protein
MMKTLPHMQDTVRENFDAAQCEFKNLQGRLVCSRLLGGDDLAELDLQLRLRSSEKIVVYIGYYRLSRDRIASTVSGQGFHSFNESASERTCSSLGMNPNCFPNCRTTELRTSR